MEISMNFLSRFALLFCLVGSVHAQSSTDYSLNDGAIRFKVPADWSMILQKTEGSPQAIAFQVRDPADQGTNTATRVTLDTRRFAGANEFASFVASGMAKAKQIESYTEEVGANDATHLRYTGMDAGTRYQYRDMYLFRENLGIHVRCVRPLLPATTSTWTKAYEQGCDLLMSSVQQ
jgi:hypothetical protein